MFLSNYSAKRKRVTTFNSSLHGLLLLNDLSRVIFSKTGQNESGFKYKIPCIEVCE